MKLLELTLDTPRENVALDEALLAEAEQSERPREVIRLWESAEPMVVIGRSSRVETEVHRHECQRRGIEIVRRTSGGAAIVAGPGCLMYAVILSYENRPALQMIAQAHRFVLETVCKSVATLQTGVKQQGTSDLAQDGKKFSGNSMRCGRTHLLYHGTLLYNFDLSLIEKFLGTPPRQPEYRESRSHGEFVRNISATRTQLRDALTNGWNAREQLVEWPRQRTTELVAEKYSKDEWNFRR